MRVEILALGLLSSIALGSTFVETRDAYVHQETAEIDKWDAEVGRLKKVTPSDARYMAADDLELQVKELRGDLLKLKATSEESWAPLQSKFEQKLSTARKAFKDIEKPTPPSPKVPARQ